MEDGKDVNIAVDMNHTELVQLAKFGGIPGASKAAPREVLVKALRTNTPINISNPVDRFKARLSEWIKRWWSSKFRSQAIYPECPDCELCGDLRALDCFETNESEIR